MTQDDHGAGEQRSTEAPPAAEEGAIRAHVELTDADLIAALRYQGGANRILLFWGGLAAVLTAMGLATSGPRTILYFGLFAALIAILQGIVLPWRGARNVPRDRRAFDIGFFSAGIDLSSSQGTARLQWSAVERLEETQQAFLLLAPPQIYVVPRRALAPEEIEPLRALFAEHVSEPAPKRSGWLRSVVSGALLLLLLAMAWAVTRGPGG